MGDNIENPYAFPQPIGGSQIHIGMTLRDYFAAAALQGMLSNTPLRFEVIGDSEAMAAKSYEIATIMLKERVK